LTFCPTSRIERGVEHPLLMQESSLLVQILKPIEIETQIIIAILQANAELKPNKIKDIDKIAIRYCFDLCMDSFV
jgi:hypothetical protein